MFNGKQGKFALIGAGVIGLLLIILVFSIGKAVGSHNSNKSEKAEKSVASSEENKKEKKDKKDKKEKKNKKDKNGSGIDFDKFSKDFLAELQKESEDSIYAYAAQSYTLDNLTLSDVEYAGYIITYPDPDPNKYVIGENHLYYVCKGTVTDEDGNSVTIYYPVDFGGVEKGDDGYAYGTCYGLRCCNYSQHAYIGIGGFENPLTVFADLTHANRNFLYEYSDMFKEYDGWELVKSLDDVSKKSREELENDAAGIANEYIARELSGEDTVSDMSVLGEILLVDKDEEKYPEFTNNIYFVVFKIELSSKSGEKDPSTLYLPVEYDGVLKLADGSSKNVITNGLTKGNAFYRGYDDAKEMYSDLVTSYRSLYDYEVSDGLKEFE